MLVRGRVAGPFSKMERWCPRGYRRWNQAAHRGSSTYSAISGELDLLVERWSPGGVAHSVPAGIRWPVPALDLLSDKLVQWAMRHGLPFHAYTSQEVTEVMTGHPNASRDQLAYAVMVFLCLTGQGKTTHEWEALAVGRYHFILRATASTPKATRPPASGKLFSPAAIVTVSLFSTGGIGQLQLGL